jgi:HK97 family phage major capsid protein
MSTALAEVSEAAASALRPGTAVQRGLLVQRAAINTEARTVEIAFASELPYERWWGIEILECTPDAVQQVRMADGAAPVLWNHGGSAQIGVVESVSIGSDRVCRAVVRLSRNARATEVWDDIVDGIVRNVSVGYMIDRAELVVTGDDEVDTYRVTRWTPYEISFVPVPADPSVGVGRSAEDPRMQRLTHLPAAPAASPVTTPPVTLEIRTMTTAVETPPAAPALNVSADADAVRRAERERATTIRTIGEQFARFNGVALAATAIDDGSTVDAFRSVVMNAVAAGQTQAVTHLDLSRGDQKRFSIMRAIRAMVDRDWSGAGFERECNQAICKRAGIAEAVHGGFYLPADIQTRDLTVGVSAAGGFLVGTDLRPQDFIDLLRARTAVGRLGATMLRGLVGNVTIPKWSGASTAYWLANEATAINESTPATGQLALTPKTVGAYTEVSRLLMLQGTPAADDLVLRDFSKVLALAVDLAALEGSGSAGQPTGISATAGIGAVTGTSLPYAGVVEFQTDVAAGNALDLGSAYVTTPAVASLMMQRQRFSSTDTPLWTGNVLDGQMAGFRATTTTQLTAASMIFGDFSQVVIGEWGMFEIAMNPYANFPAGITGIRGMQTIDIGVRQAAAFSRATSIT